MQFNNIHMSELMPVVSAHGQPGGPKYAEKQHLKESYIVLWRKESTDYIKVGEGRS